MVPPSTVIEAFAARLAGYKLSKGAVQFPLDKPIPKTLVVKMVEQGPSELRNA